MSYRTILVQAVTGVSRSLLPVAIDQGGALIAEQIALMQRAASRAPSCAP